MLARPTGLEPVTYGLAYHHSFHCPRFRNGVCGLDYIFAIAGGARIVSTDPDADQRIDVRLVRRGAPYPWGSAIAWQITPQAFRFPCPRSPLVPVGTDHRFPRYSHRHDALRVYRYSALHSEGSVSPRRLLMLRSHREHKGRCSIRLSYGRIEKRILGHRSHNRICHFRFCGIHLVGVEGFEPPTPCSQSRCATRLRHTPSANY
jgi:hypothetical protein